MGRERLIYYGLVLALILSVVYLLNWWNNIQNELSKLPLTGASPCGVVSVKAGTSRIAFSSELELGSNYERFYLQFTDNADPNLLCPEMPLAMMLGKCQDGECNYAVPIEAWEPFMSDLKGLARIDSSLFPLGKGEYALKFKQANSLYAWSSPVFINVEAEEGIKNISVNLADYLTYEQGDVFIYDSKSYLGKGERLGSPVTGTTRIEIEHDSAWGEYIVRPWRILKDNSALYWHPIPLGQEYTGTDITDDENMRLMMIAPQNQVKDKRLASYDQYIYAVGHKAYHRSSLDGDRQINGEDLNRVSVYTSKDNKYPALFFGNKEQILPATYLQNNSIRNISNLDGNTLPVLLADQETNRSWYLRVEKQAWPVTIGDEIYDDVVRLDMYEGPGDFLSGQMPVRESWYLAKGVGLIKVAVKYFSADAFGALSDRYPYINSCSKDPDCMSEDILAPHLIMELQSKTKVEATSFTISSSSGPVCSLDGKCLTTFNANTDNGVYLNLSDNNYTGYVESKDDKGNIAKIFWFEKGQSFVPASYLNTLNSSLIYYSLRKYIPAEELPGETRLIKQLAWSDPQGLMLK
jgi:hypothetical protein